MLNLPTVTLLAIDCFHPDKTIATIRHSMLWVKFAEVIFVTDTNRHPHTLRLKDEGIRLEHRFQRDAKRCHPDFPRLSLPIDYEMDVLRLPSEILRTEHLLFQEWDSAICNPFAWNNGWLKYDFIGAPWPHHFDPGWPKCDDSNNVGNGGFALKSKKFVDACRELADKHRDDPSITSSDRWMCRTVRKELEQRKMRFAPEEVAARFSCEGLLYSGQFGMHGKGTFELNGIGERFAHVRP